MSSRGIPVEKEGVKQDTWDELFRWGLAEIVQKPNILIFKSISAFNW
jgi:hypothetical protein